MEASSFGGWLPCSAGGDLELLGPAPRFSLDAKVAVEWSAHAGTLIEKDEKCMKCYALLAAATRDSPLWTFRVLRRGNGGVERRQAIFKLKWTKDAKRSRHNLSMLMTSNDQPMMMKIVMSWGCIQGMGMEMGPHTHTPIGQVFRNAS